MSCLLYTSNASGNFSLEILEEQNGKLTHIKSLKEWTEGGATKGFAATPNGVTVAPVSYTHLTPHSVNNLLLLQLMQLPIILFA